MWRNGHGKVYLLPYGQEWKFPRFINGCPVYRAMTACTWEAAYVEGYTAGGG